MRRINILVMTLFLNGCLFVPKEPQPDAFSPVEEQFRHCASEQARLRVRSGSILVPGDSAMSLSQKITCYCLQTLHLEHDDFAEQALYPAENIVRSYVRDIRHYAPCAGRNVSYRGY